MTCRPLLTLFALALMLSSAAQAEILIYAGSFQRTEYTTKFKPVTSKCFVVADPITEQFAVINYGRIEGTKKREVSGPFMGEYLGGTINGVDFDYYYFVKVEDEALGGQRTGNFMRGLRATVQISQTGENPVTEQRAKTLKGTIRSIIFTGLGGAFLGGNFTVKLDTTRTVEANVAGRSFTQVFQDLNAELQVRGFVN